MSDCLTVRAAYDRWAATYDSDDNATRDLDALVLRAARLPLENASVIELGAGTGKNTIYLAPPARRVLALDLSPAMLDRARSLGLGAHVSFVEHDVTRRWPVADSKADLVIGNLVLEHVADLGPVVAEARRALRSGGLMFLCELHPYRQLLGRQAQFRDAGKPILVKAYAHSVSEYVNAALERDFALERLDEHLEDAVAVGQSAETPPRLLSMLFRRR